MFFIKVIIAAIIISFASWLAGKKPELAGFIMALPIASMIALVFSYVEHENAEISMRFAKSILFAIPFSLLFFLPFLAANKFNYSFHIAYVLGLLFLLIGFLIHRYFMNFV